MIRMPDHDPPTTPPEPTKPGRLSRSDPPHNAASHSRPPILLVLVVVLLATGLVVLHLTGVVGPGAH